MNFKLIGGILGIIIVIIGGVFVLKNKESKADVVVGKKQEITVSHGDADDEKEIVFEKSFFKKETDGALTLLISNHPKASCDRFSPKSHKENEITIHVNLFNKNKEPLIAGSYERESDYSLGPEIISKETTYFFNGSSIGSVDVATLDLEEGYISGYLDLDDSRGMKIEGPFEAGRCW